MKENAKGLESFPDILTVMELKEYLGIGREQAYTLVKTEDFPVKRIGRRILIYKPNLIKWLESNIVS
ncbi:prophage CP4-57 regulatory family protein [Bacillus cereus]|uniref:helix-turn-helix domain-containing protein n=1 Tax=Bacillus TaxID=1386 RepID=UPI0005010195|nr:MULTISPECIES: helix-turn-helix domain-containing protein [Bacillus]HDR7923534.1 helix-turn-helix domain-containing protein [Bacillus paranthracis]HDX9495702.1 helix-turn-helix domain-containing protein [Bacillus thuringiensis]KFK72043.1 prophage CP4-57 regulatory family protein [Bacillus cereus]MDA1516043.1 helix-turn-helix domain-containing protein [Bacillus cereus group sp. TH40LC]MDX5832057.1 helix-turn-helix domain-containing protein [Bacillus cereus group sp. BfR-BA-01748]